MLNLTIVITKKRLLEFFSISNSILAAFDTVLMIMQDSLTQQQQNSLYKQLLTYFESKLSSGWQKTRINPPTLLDIVQRHPGGESVGAPIKIKYGEMQQMIPQCINYKSTGKEADIQILLLIETTIYLMICWCRLT